MEFSRKEVSCMRVNSDDVDSIREVTELYFETRDCDENGEASFTPDDDSSSESETELDQDEEFDIDSSETDLTENAKAMPSTQTHVSANLGKMSKHVAEVSQLVTSWTVETTAMNFPPRSLISSFWERFKVR